MGHPAGVESSALCNCEPARGRYLDAAKDAWGCTTSFSSSCDSSLSRKLYLKRENPSKLVVTV